MASDIAARYVVGGDLEQARAYARSIRLAPDEIAQVIDSPSDLRNLCAPRVALVGSYLMRPDVKDFDAMLETVGAEVEFESV